MNRITNLRNKVLATEHRLREPICSFAESTGALSFYSRSYPGFYYGNGVLIRRPELGDSGYWERVFDETVRTQNAVHRLFVFESDSRSASLQREFRDAGYAMFRERYMVLESPMQIRKRRDFIVESINDTGAWEALELLQAQDDKDIDDVAELSSGLRNLFRKTMEVSEGVGIRWFALRDERTGEYVSSVGIFHDGPLARLQTVIAPPRFRRNGYVRYLLGRIINDALATDGIKAVALSCDRGTIAERIYLSLGFRPVAATASCYREEKK